MTFTEIYQEKKKQPTPASAFINEISLLTKKSKVSVIHWAQGRSVPEPKTVTIIAKHLNTDGDVLFPRKPRKYGKR